MKATYASRSIIPATDGTGTFAVRAGAGLGGFHAILAGADRRLDRWVERLFTWQRRIADRRSLESLDDRMLQDIGLTRGDVFVESTKPFWKA